MSHWKALLLVPALAAAPGLHAETLYVIEQLVVGAEDSLVGGLQRRPRLDRANHIARDRRRVI